MENGWLVYSLPRHRLRQKLDSLYNHITFCTRTGVPVTVVPLFSEPFFRIKNIRIHNIQ